MDLTSPRVWLALTIVVLAGGIVGAVAGMAPGALAAGAGVAAVLLAATEDPGERIESDAEETAPLDAAALLDSIDEPVLVARDRRIVEANPAARALLGRHIVGEDIRTAIRHPAAAERLIATDTDRAAIDLVGLGTLDQRWRMRVAPLGDGTRVVHLANQTGSYAAERMRVDFVANASHELRTPLTSIIGYAETLGEEAGDDPAVRGRFLKIIFDEARRMQRLVEDLLSLSRIEADKYRPPADAVDLAELVEEVRLECEDGHAARGRTVEATVASDLPPVTGDRPQLSQMVHNLVGNALKYGAPGTEVYVTLAREGPRTVRLVVADRGEGIAAEHLPRLTERFYRVDPGRSRSLGGTGLGLAIVKHIVERHRGRLDIVSELGVGTRVGVTLPVAEGAVIKP